MVGAAPPGLQEFSALPPPLPTTANLTKIIILQLLVNLRLNVLTYKVGLAKKQSVYTRATPRDAGDLATIN